MKYALSKVLGRGCTNLWRSTNFHLKQKCNFSGYKIYSDGLINPRFTSDLKTITDGVKIPIYRILDEKGNLVDGCTAPFSDEETFDIYKSMLEFSTWDSILYAIQRQGRISFYIVNDGEEGIHFGIGKVLGPGDHLYCHYRELGILVNRGFDYTKVLYQLFGTKYDEGKGRQMCVCYTNKDLNIHSISVPLASQLPHAAGCGYALRLKKKKNVAIAFCGEGAASEGDFYAALNFAAVRKSQTMFVCKNNMYAISTNVKDQYKGDGVAPRAVSLGIETLRVDGNDMFACYLATKKLRDICINEGKPVFAEFMGYRYGHHSTSDDSSLYKPAEELNAWRQVGVHPISRLFLYLKNKNLITEKDEQLLRKEYNENVLKTLKKYENVKRCNIVNGIFDNVYANEEWHIKEQRENFENFFQKYKKHYDTSRYEMA